MKIGRLLSFTILFISFLSCENEKVESSCKLVEFITQTVSTGVKHTDILSLKDGRIENIRSSDYRISRNDTVNRITFKFEYGTNGNLKYIYENIDNQRFTTFSFIFDDTKLIKALETVEGNIKTEYVISYDSQQRIVSIITSNLLGYNREFEYGENNNPVKMVRYDTSPFTIYFHEFDSNQNLFGGLPEFKYLWIMRPLFNFIPFGLNNIKSVRIFSIRGNFLVEEPTLKSSREIIYNAQGFPTSIKRLNDNNNSSLVSESTLKYTCN